MSEPSLRVQRPAQIQTRKPPLRPPAVNRSFPLALAAVLEPRTETQPRGRRMSIIVPNRALEAEACLSKFPDIRAFHLMWTDLAGVQRGKLLRRDDLVPAWKDGRYLPISAMVLDVTGQDIPETGLVFDEGDRDLL